MRFFCKPIVRKIAQLWIFMNFGVFCIKNQKQTTTVNKVFLDSRLSSLIFDFCTGAYQPCDQEGCALWKKRPISFPLKFR
jgi:hypothetical protein